MPRKLSVKIVCVLIMVMVLIMTAFSIYFVRSRTAFMEEELLSKGIILARTGARSMERILAEAVASGRLTKKQLFDKKSLPIPNTFPQKYHSQFDAFMDRALQKLEDEFLKE